MRRISVTFLSILIFLKLITGQHRLVCPTQPVEAREGDDVTLQCALDPPVNVVDYTVDWKRTDLNKVVHSYRHKQDHYNPQMGQYRGRTTFSRKDLSSGILLLLLSSVQPSDSGPYRCFVPAWRAGCTIVLVVARRDQNKTKIDTSSTAGPPLVEATGPNNPHSDGESRRPVHAGTISSVVVFFFFVLVVGLLMTGIKQNCMKRLKGREDQKPETAENGLDVQQLDTRAAEGDEDLERPAENGLRSIACFK
ncbi:butyrophilin subfamily 2 member A2-like isoform X2 [Chaetodon auriga]|uniref:butyrophilin subfamily 2 member A2-like isoform X2 n=1 Tax=Chaetodon auriga TaxID=39042 RepID=UPI004032E614